jgi:hypothetical protein
VTCSKVGTGRNRRFFKEKQLAETFLDQKKIEQQNYGSAGASFEERMRAEYIECTEHLAPFGKTPRDAVAFYLPQLKASSRSCRARELVDELLRAAIASSGFGK